MRMIQFLMCLNALFGGCFTSFSHASPESAETVHFCLPLDIEQMSARDSTYAASKQALNLNVGPPRTVRMIYFLPNDRPYRASVVDSMRRTIRQIQTFYGEQMQAHGYGYKTLAVESDASGEPIVHRVAGKYPVNHYSDDTFQRVFEEIGQVFDIQANIYLLVLDNGVNTVVSRGREVLGVGGQTGKGGGVGLVSGDFVFITVAHEIGHAFGLKHDFNDGTNIMSYGLGRDRLSACSASVLAIHPYFSAGVGTTEGPGPTVELISETRYRAGLKSVPVKVRIRDSDGLHLVILFVPTREPHPAAEFLEVKACRILEGERVAVVEFDYNGVIPSKKGFSSLIKHDEHPIIIKAFDTAGDGGQKADDNGVGWASFTLSKIPPENVPLLTFEHYGGGLISFSPDGAILAGRTSLFRKDEVYYSSVNLWSTAATHGDNSRRPLVPFDG